MRTHRGVAQLGSGHALGAGCRRFESFHPEERFSLCLRAFSRILTSHFRSDKRLDSRSRLTRFRQVDLRGALRLGLFTTEPQEVDATEFRLFELRCSPHPPQRCRPGGGNTEAKMLQTGKGLRRRWLKLDGLSHGGTKLRQSGISLKQADAPAHLFSFQPLPLPPGFKLSVFARSARNEV